MKQKGIRSQSVAIKDLERFQTGEVYLPQVVVVEEIRIESSLDKTGHTSWKIANMSTTK